MKGISSFNTTELNGEFYLEVFHTWEKKIKKDAINAKKSIPQKICSSQIKVTYVTLQSVPKHSHT